MKLQTFALALLIAACGSAPGGAAQIDPPFPTPGPVGTTARVYPVESGWFNGQPVKYYNLGANTPLNPDDPSRVRVEPVWAFVVGQNDDGAPIFLEINPLPTFAPDGSFGILAEVMGRTHDDLLAEVLALGLRRLGLC